MKDYNVVFYYSVRVTAESENEAEDMAWSAFGEANPSSGDDFVCTVDEIEVEDQDMSTCIYCQRPVTLTDEGWADENATGDDSIWRLVCDENGSFPASHEGVTA
jgi:hypothetical protein